MKLWEIEWIQGNKYLDSNNKMWVVSSTLSELRSDEDIMKSVTISNYYTSKELVTLDFVGQQGEVTKIDNDKKAERLFDNSIFLSHYGMQSQLIIAIEEMAELTKELTKNIRGRENRLCIMEEIADVELMLDILKLIYSIRQDTLEEIKDRKIGRTKDIVKWELSYKEFEPSTEEEF